MNAARGVNIGDGNRENETIRRPRAIPHDPPTDPDASTSPNMIAFINRRQERVERRLGPRLGRGRNDHEREIGGFDPLGERRAEIARPDRNAPRFGVAPPLTHQVGDPVGDRRGAIAIKADRDDPRSRFWKRIASTVKVERMKVGRIFALRHGWESEPLGVAAISPTTRVLDRSIQKPPDRPFKDAPAVD